MGKGIMKEKPAGWDSLTCGEKLRAFDAPPWWRFEDLTPEQREEFALSALEPIDEWENPEDMFKDFE